MSFPPTKSHLKLKTSHTGIFLFQPKPPVARECGGREGADREWIAWELDLTLSVCKCMCMDVVVTSSFAVASPPYNQPAISLATLDLPQRKMMF